MDEAADDRYPALRARQNGSTTQEVDRARRLLWRAFQRGELSAEEFARTLQQLEPGLGAVMRHDPAEDAEA
jgi:hypothetical protein